MKTGVCIQRWVAVFAFGSALLACKPRRGSDASVAAGPALPPGVVAIRWNDTAEAFIGRDVGVAHAVFCPPNGAPGPVFGTDIYSMRSSICTAAVHAGRITLAQGGVVQWYPWTQASRMPASNHWGVQSQEALREIAMTFTPYVPDHWRLHFELLGRLPYNARQPRGEVNALPWAPEPPVPAAVEAEPVELDWTSNATRWARESATVHRARCPVRPRGSARAVYGSVLYSSDSSICTAALHDGRITALGGTITLETKGPQSSFEGAERNGVRSRRWGRWPGSYSFHGGGRRRPIVPATPVPAAWSTTADQLHGMDGTEVTFQCPPGGELQPVWGGGEGGPFASGSSVCTAGVFAGAATFAQGGAVRIRMVPSVNIFASGDQNNVQTGLTFGGADRSGFVVVR